MSFILGLRSPVAIGWNADLGIYYNGGGAFVNRLKESAYTSGTPNSLGFPAAGVAVSYLVIGHGAYKWWAHKPGIYVIKGTGTGATITTSGSGFTSDVHATTNGVAFRRTVTVVAFPAPTGEAAVTFSAVEYLRVAVSSGGAVDMDDLIACHENDEAAVDAGAVWSADIVSMLSTVSGGPARVMPMMGPNAVWVQDAADITPDGSVARHQVQMASDGRSAGSQLVRTPSPEDLGRLAAETNNPIWVTMWPMMTDAAITAFFERLFTTYPANLSLPVEGGNEPWNPAFPQNSGWLRYEYGKAENQNTGFTGDYTADAKNTAHFSLRCWKLAEAVFGARVVRVFNVQNGSQTVSGISLDYEDPGIISIGTPVGELADSIAVASYFQLAYDNASKPRGVTQIPASDLGLSRRKLVKNRQWVNGATNDNNAADWVARAWKNGIDAAADRTATWVLWLSGRGYSTVSHSYEGIWSHDDIAHISVSVENDSPTTAAGLAGVVMAYTASTGALVPTNATLSGFSFTDSGEVLGDWFTNGDLVQIANIGATGITGNRTWLCRVISGALYIYSTQADYDSETPRTGGSDGNVMVVATTLLTAWGEFLMDQLWGNPTEHNQSVLSYCVNALRSNGITTACMFQAIGNASTSWRDMVSFRPWAAKPDGYWQADTAAVTWIKAAT